MAEITTLDVFDVMFYIHGMLNYLMHSGPEGLPPLLIVHGLYGSARNWGVIAKRMSDSRTVIAVDLRNHGDSPWFETHTYFDLANDLAELINELGIRPDIMGHSMGGKAAMVLALRYPDVINRLIVADIAPVAYTHDQTQYIKAMQSVDLASVQKRSDASEQLAKMVPEPTLQSFFTQSLDVKNRKWKLNLDVLEKEMHHIIGFPEVTGQFDKPTLFLTGAKSTYVLPEHRSQTKSLFPNAKFAKIPEAGHWLHAEKPREFEASLRAFFS